MCPGPWSNTLLLIFLNRKHFKQVRSSVITLQKHLRRHVQHKRFVKQRQAALVLQRHRRGQVARARARKLREEKKKVEEEQKKKEEEEKGASGTDEQEETSDTDDKKVTFGHRQTSECSLDMFNVQNEKNPFHAVNVLMVLLSAG